MLLVFIDIQQQFLNQNSLNHNQDISATISEANLVNLSHANVRIVHVPDRKSNAADRQIMLDLVRFERIHHPPATIVLISGDIDYVGILSGLRHQAGFRVILIHNKPAKEELKATVHEHYQWELFTLPLLQQPMRKVNDYESNANDRASRTPQMNNRMRHSSRNRSLRRRDPSPHIPMRSQPPPQPLLQGNNQDIKKYQCPKCPNDFETIQSLQQHQSAKKHLFSCPVCEDKFFIEISQIQHQKDKKHYILDYRCHQCNRFFSKLEILNQHQQDTGHNISPLPQTTYPKPILRRQTLPPSMQIDRDKKIETVDDQFVIILGGIEAIKEHYAKQSTKLK
ncbi:hypothetical protein I4U23_018406 [Adineta vaga]|nr:hypothetical protein I4U23_018406 [Adineta vaga]